MVIGLLLLYFVFTLMVLYRGLSALVWEIGSGIVLFIATFILSISFVGGLLLWGSIGLVVAIVRVQPVRRWIEDFAYDFSVKVVPKLSKTEEDALNAGDTWLEQDIFRGKPDWQRLSEVDTALTKEEQSFLDNEVNTLCSMLNEWQISQANDLPEPVWQYIKDNGFFGLVIGKNYGGKGFSARAHSDIVMKIASRSGVAAVTIMVPNSLGPGELLTYYGSEAQKDYYLPRLAKGLEIPCFALTEPGAGSDATSIQSEAIVVKETIAGKSQLALKLTFDKRWITLSPVATLIGLAVNLKDPDGLLQGEGETGITCILIARDTPNVSIGNRHLAANQPFMNGALRGDNVLVPISTIIGGQKNAGQGWKMLVECLSIGRSISLPALGAAASAVSYLSAGAFSRIRRQFGVEIAQFEGIEEKLAEVAGLNYLINATRLLTVAAVNAHKKPSVASAITKYFNTELARVVVNHAMDIHAGRAVVVGPRNYLANLYQGLPISITVEGANIMSRNLLIFGQGSMACHPFVRQEFYAISSENKVTFSEILWQHGQYFLTNFAKTLCSTWTGGVLIAAPHNALKKEYQQLAKLSHAFAWLSDLALMALGGELKRKERLSARLADAMSYLYMALGVLRQYELHADSQEEEIHARWALQYCFYQTQQALIAFCNNFPNRILGRLMKFVAFPFGQIQRRPRDSLDSALSRLMVSNNPYRDRLKDIIYLSGNPQEPLDKMECTLQRLIKDGELYKKVADLRRCKFSEFTALCTLKVTKGELSQAEMDALVALEKARWDALAVDEFQFDAMKAKNFASITDGLKTPFDQ